MRVELIARTGGAVGTQLLDIDLAMLVLSHLYGPIGFSIKTAPIHTMDLKVDGKIIPWPDLMTEVF